MSPYHDLSPYASYLLPFSNVVIEGGDPTAKARDDLPLIPPPRLPCDDTHTIKLLASDSKQKKDPRKTHKQ